MLYRAGSNASVAGGTGRRTMSTSAGATTAAVAPTATATTPHSRRAAPPSSAREAGQPGGEIGETDEFAALDGSGVGDEPAVAAT